MGGGWNLGSMLVLLSQVALKSKIFNVPYHQDDYRKSHHKNDGANNSSYQATFVTGFEKKVRRS